MTDPPIVVVVDAPLPDQQRVRIVNLDCRIKLKFAEPLASHLPRSLIHDANVIYTTAADFDPADAPRLSWVQLNTAAVNSVLNNPIAGAGIPIANVSGAYSVAVAECTIGMLLALTRCIPLACRFQVDHRWPEDYLPFQGVDLHGKTMSIVGYGSIGRQVARLGQAFGLTILACKRHPEIRHDSSFLIPGTGDPEGTIPHDWFGPRQIPDMFRRSDVAVVAAPLTPETTGLIGAAALEALPAHAYLLSIGRGPVVDEAALSRHLAAGKLAGAGLDVFAVEPLPASNPLWGLPNVLILPHIGSWTRQQTHMAAEVLLENLARSLRGEPLINVIDSKLHY